MGIYDQANDTEGRTPVAMWKPQDGYPKAPLSNFEEPQNATAESPSLYCDDANGIKYLLHGAWLRNVQKCVKLWGSNVAQWETATLRIAKNGRQLELTPLATKPSEEVVA
jgi:hypothetical protein